LHKLLLDLILAAGKNKSTGIANCRKGSVAYFETILRDFREPRVDSLALKGLPKLFLTAPVKHTTQVIDPAEGEALPSNRQRRHRGRPEDSLGEGFITIGGPQAMMTPLPADPRAEEAVRWIISVTG
jgi:hypothetical protein